MAAKGIVYKMEKANFIKMNINKIKDVVSAVGNQIFVVSCGWAGIQPTSMN
jgi:hypothetical protein